MPPQESARAEDRRRCDSRPPRPQAAQRLRLKAICRRGASRSQVAVAPRYALILGRHDICRLTVIRPRFGRRLRQSSLFGSGPALASGHRVSVRLARQQKDDGAELPSGRWISPGFGDEERVAAARRRSLMFSIAASAQVLRPISSFQAVVVEAMTPRATGFDFASRNAPSAIVPQLITGWRRATPRRRPMPRKRIDLAMRARRPIAAAHDAIRASSTPGQALFAAALISQLRDASSTAPASNTPSHQKYRLRYRAPGRDFYCLYRGRGRL